MTLAGIPSSASELWLTSLSPPHIHHTHATPRLTMAAHARCHRRSGAYVREVVQLGPGPRDPTCQPNAALSYHLAGSGLTPALASTRLGGLVASPAWSRLLPSPPLGPYPTLHPWHMLPSHKCEENGVLGEGKGKVALPCTKQAQTGGGGGLQSGNSQLQAKDQSLQHHKESQQQKKVQ